MEGSDSIKQERLSKFQRQPKAVADRKLTERSLEIVSAVARYRFLPTSLLVRLIDGNEDVTHRHLQQLFHKGLMNRFAFPRTGGSNEFNYYLDNSRALSLLITQGLVDKSDFDLAAVRANQEKAYYRINEWPSELPGRMLFLHHELMLSRFHFMLELGCRNSRGRVELLSWKQGSELHNSVADLETGELIPHRPDAFFTLRFPAASEGQQLASFFYEADRNRTSIPKMLTKLRGHYEFLRQGKLEAKYGIRKLRAVLIETLDTKWAEQLRAATMSICKVPLFWFSASSIFEARRKGGGSTDNAVVFLNEPEIVFGKVWMNQDAEIVKLDA